MSILRRDSAAQSNRQIISELALCLQRLLKQDIREQWFSLANVREFHEEKARQDQEKAAPRAEKAVRRGRPRRKSSDCTDSIQTV